MGLDGHLSPTMEVITFNDHPTQEILDGFHFRYSGLDPGSLNSNANER
jgi:hypothetical protein